MADAATDAARELPLPDERPSDPPAPNALIDEGEYADGTKVGVWRSYHPDGSLKQEKRHRGAPDASAEPDASGERSTT